MSALVPVSGFSSNVTTSNGASEDCVSGNVTTEAPGTTSDENACTYQPGITEIIYVFQAAERIGDQLILSRVKKLHFRFGILQEIESFSDTVIDLCCDGTTGDGTTPGDTTPGDTTPGDTTPGDTTPPNGGTTPPGDTTPLDCNQVICEWLCDYGRWTQVTGCDSGKRSDCNCPTPASNLCGEYDFFAYNQHCA